MVVNNIYEFCRATDLFIEEMNKESVTGKALCLHIDDTGHAIERARIYIVETRKNVFRINVWCGKNNAFLDSFSSAISKKRSIDNNIECKYTRIAESELIDVLQAYIMVLYNDKFTEKRPTKKVELKKAQ